MAEPARLLVGREDESVVLRSRLDVVAAGSGCCVVVEGEPGIGKTRLIAEVHRESVERGFTILTAVIEEHQRDRPFGAMTSALLGTNAGDDPRRARLRQLLDETDTTPGLPPDRRYRIADAIEDVIEAEANARPVLLLIEDVHWADPSTVLALRVLSARNDHPLLVAVTTRPLP